MDKINTNKPPVSEGDIIEGKIETIGEKGDGILKINGYTIFVPNTKVDDYVKVKINKVLSRYAFAEITNEEDYP